MVKILLTDQGPRLKIKLPGFSKTQIFPIITNNYLVYLLKNFSQFRKIQYIRSITISHRQKVRIVTQINFIFIWGSSGAEDGVPKIFFPVSCCVFIFRGKAIKSSINQRIAKSTIAAVIVISPHQSFLLQFNQCAIAFRRVQKNNWFTMRPQFRFSGSEWNKVLLRKFFKR